MNFEVIEPGDSNTYNGLIANTLNEVGGTYIQLNVKEGKLPRVSSSTSRLTVSGSLTYRHAKLVVKNGKIELEDQPYRASPYPVEQILCEVYLHSEGKVWAIAKQHDLVFFSNAQTEQLLVCQQIDNKTPKSKRVAEKIGKGYALLGNKKYDPATNSFI